jgi:hypothetical protein
MRDDLLKEQLMGYARYGAENAFQPGSGAIRRRARLHYQRVAALSVAGVLLAAGLGIGLGLHGHGTTPTVNLPQPPPTSPTPQVVPSTTAAPITKPHPTTTTGTVQSGPPSSFVTLVGPPNPSASQAMRVGVVSTSTGKVIRYLSGPPAAGTWLARPVVSVDHRWVYYTVNADGQLPRTYRVPLVGGPATKVAETAGSNLVVAPDGSKLLFDARIVPPGRSARYGLAVRDLAHGTERFIPFPFPQAGDVYGYAWSPDSRQVALIRGPVTDAERATVPIQLFLLEVATGRWQQAVTFDAGHGPAPEFGQLNVAWPQARRVAFVANIAASGKLPAKHQLVGVDPRTGKLTPSVVLASNPNSASSVQVKSLDFDASGRYLIYAVGMSTWWFGGQAPVRVSKFSAFDNTSRTYTGGNW